MGKPRIAIIGAGITGLHLAGRLSAFACIEIFEKSRGIGGRMSTRRSGAFQFDHGAQYFTAHGLSFQKFLEPFVESGVVAQWTPRLAALGADAQARVWNAPRYVAVPGMTALCKAMAERFVVHRETRVARVEQSAACSWELTSEAGKTLGCYDWVVSTAPAEQSARLMPACFAQYEALSAARMLGCYSLMIGGLDLASISWDAAIVAENPIAWIALDNSKPGRSGATSLLCQADNAWAEAHLEHDKEDVQSKMTDGLTKATGLSVQNAEYISLHKWRFAKVADASGQPYLLDVKNKLAAAGDWCGAGRVEAGFDSAEALASRMLQLEVV